MPAIVPRWEWRTFGEGFPEIEVRISGEPHDLKISRDTYILSRVSDANVKIRARLLDVKLLQQADRGIELWLPVLKASFPIDAATCDAVFGLWHLAPPRTERARYTLPEFLDDVVAREPGLVAIDVAKERRGIDVDGCQVEVAFLTVGTRPIRTVAVEHEDPERVRRVVRALGLDRLANVNYVRALKSMTGAAPVDS